MVSGPAFHDARGFQLAEEYRSLLACAKAYEALFTKWDKFLEPQRHPKWRDVNLAATVLGWTRWSVAEEMLSRMQKDPRVAESQQKQKRVGEFLSFLKDQGPAVMNLTQEQRETLYCSLSVVTVP
jgi:hypothetical protein